MTMKSKGLILTLTLGILKVAQSQECPCSIKAGALTCLENTIKGIPEDLKEERSIEDDVQTNKEDIIDLRMTDGRHDFLISDGMAMTNYINNTIIPTLDHRLDTKINTNVAELHDYDAYIDSTRPPLGSIVAWLPAYSANAQIPSGKCFRLFLFFVL